MAKCYVVYPVNSKSYQVLEQLAGFNTSDALAGERQVLAQQSGMFSYSTNGVLSDANIDAVKQLNNTYQITRRAVGARLTVSGELGVAGSVATAPVLCFGPLPL